MAIGGGHIPVRPWYADKNSLTSDRRRLRTPRKTALRRIGRVVRDRKRKVIIHATECRLRTGLADGAAKGAKNIVNQRQFQSSESLQRQDFLNQPEMREWQLATGNGNDTTVSRFVKQGLQTVASPSPEPPTRSAVLMSTNFLPLILFFAKY
jgi:hypothetical protein